MCNKDSASNMSWLYVATMVCLFVLDTGLGKVFFAGRIARAEAPRGVSVAAGELSPDMVHATPNVRLDGSAQSYVTTPPCRVLEDTELGCSGTTDGFDAALGNIILVRLLQGKGLAGVQFLEAGVSENGVKYAVVRCYEQKVPGQSLAPDNLTVTTRKLDYGYYVPTAEETDELVGQVGVCPKELTPRARQFVRQWQRDAVAKRGKPRQLHRKLWLSDLLVSWDYPTWLRFAPWYGLCDTGVADIAKVRLQDCAFTYSSYPYTDFGFRAELVVNALGPIQVQQP